MLVLASVFLLAPIIDVTGKSMKPAGWLMLLSIVAGIVFAGIYTLRYVIVVGDDELIVSGFARKEFRISNISGVSVEVGRFSPSAVITFKSGDKITISSYIQGFDDLVALLRAKVNVEKPT
jgi:hypothetical protein